MADSVCNAQLLEKLNALAEQVKGIASTQNDWMHNPLLGPSIAVIGVLLGAWLTYLAQSRIAEKNRSHDLIKEKLKIESDKEKERRLRRLEKLEEAINSCIKFNNRLLNLMIWIAKPNSLNTEEKLKFLTSFESELNVEDLEVSLITCGYLKSLTDKIVEQIRNNEINRALWLRQIKIQQKSNNNEHTVKSNDVANELIKIIEEIGKIKDNLLLEYQRIEAGGDLGQKITWDLPPQVPTPPA